MKIVFRSDMNINADNISSNIFVISKEFLFENNTLCVYCNTDNVPVIEEILTRCGYLNYQILDDTIMVAPRGAAFEDIEEEEQANEVIVEDDDANEDVGVEEQEPAPGITVELIPITESEIIQRMPLLMEGNSRGSLALYTQKVNEFNRVWGNAIALKRQVDILMKIVADNEVMKNIKSDIEYLSAKCPIVESVGFTKDVPTIVINTKEIISANQPMYGPRIVGKMQILIDLRYMYAAPDNNFIKAVDIINISRNPLGEGMYWVCGHAYRVGDDPVLQICYGGYSQHIFDAIASKNVTQLFDTIVRFIQNPNEIDSWGRKIALFPKVVSSEA